MCGIAGIMQLKSPAPLPDLPERLTAMTRALRHRGPDDEGLFLSPDGRVGLGNRRLAIRDLSPAGHMPMGNAAGTVWITYNGEVYNAAELRAELEGRGYRFRSTSDTEVILHGYAAWGMDVVHRLRGMFAFAIWDARPETPGGGKLFIARDRLGVKPLYYARIGNTFLFASELKALQASGLPARAIDPAGLVGYLMLGAVPCPHTIYRDVHALEPGCTLRLPLAGPAVTPEPARYWSLPAETAGPTRYAEAVEQVRHLLEEAVRIRLVSDVPRGAFLSGGLDSSVVVALMREATTGTIRTCSMVFEEAEFSEGRYARAMAAAVDAEHYERVITAADVHRHFDRILGSMDQPTADGVNTYFVSQTAREAGLTVALSGLGGDELFGGYANTFLGIPRLLRTLPLLQAVPGAARALSAASRVLPSRHYWAKARDAAARPASPGSAYLARRGLFAPAEVRALVTPDVWDEAARAFDPVRHIAERGRAVGRGDGLFSWISRAELAVYTHHQLLADTDLMSMAHSLEVREPLLDHVLVETVLRLPDALKARRGGSKALLVDATGDRLPPLIRERNRKVGFVLPFHRWLRTALEPRVRDALLGGCDSGLLRSSGLADVWQGFANGQIYWTRAWALAVLQGWMEARDDGCAAAVCGSDYRLATAQSGT